MRIKRSEPSLVYNGTSGWQGTDTSRERAHTEDTNGKTAKMQSLVLLAIYEAGEYGITVRECYTAMGITNPNRVAPSFTNLHKAGRIERLTQQRGRHRVYVALEHVNGRECS